MKTATKVILSVSLALIVIGTGLSVMAWAVSGGNIGVTWNPGRGIARSAYSGRVQTESVNVQAFDSIDLNTDYGDVKFIASDSYRVDYSLFAELPKPEISVANGKLTIKNSVNLDRSINLFGFNNMPFLGNVDTHIYVYYPAGTQFGAVTVSNSLGQVKLKDMKITGALDVDAAMGEIVIENSSAGTTKINAEMGAVTCKGFTSGAFDADLAMGELLVKDSTLVGVTAKNSMGAVELSGDISGNINIDCSMGSIELRTSRPRTDFILDLSADMGGIEVDGNTVRNSYRDDNGAASTITADCSMGGIEIHFNY